MPFANIICCLFAALLVAGAAVDGQEGLTGVPDKNSHCPGPNQVASKQWCCPQTMCDSIQWNEKSCPLMVSFVVVQCN
jgi:hypothetical protein